MAQMTLSGSIKSDISVTASHAFDLATGTVPLRNTQTKTVDSSATSITCDLIWQSSGTIAGGGAAVDIDLNDAVACQGLMEYWGEDGTARKVQFDRVHFIYIRNTTSGAAAGESVLVVGVLVFTATVVPGMFVVTLIAPVLPIIFGVEIILGKRFEDPWAYGIGSALFVGWMMAAFFPLI